MKAFANSLKIAVLSFVAPAQWAFILIMVMIIAEYILSNSIMKDEKNLTKFTLWNAAHKWANLSVLILLGLVADSALGLQISNFPILVEYGFQANLSPSAYLISIALVIYQFQNLDSLFKKRYGKSLIEQITNIFPTILKFIGYKKN